MFTQADQHGQSLIQMVFMKMEHTVNGTLIGQFTISSMLLQ